MSSLNKLAIRGIRSFDDKSLSIIEFFSPVTVIVGHNGSGKTTIIECLKYATTGEQPPGTRGGAFVHDPKMANEKEVKAQVKLRFYAANGTRMVVVRNLSVTVKKTAGLTMKTLESILGLADGEETNGKVSFHNMVSKEFLIVLSEPWYQQNVPRWTRRFHNCSEYQRPSSRMSYFVTRKIHIGPFLNPRYWRRNSMRYSRLPGVLLSVLSYGTIQNSILMQIYKGLGLN